MKAYYVLIFHLQPMKPVTHVDLALPVSLEMVQNVQVIAKLTIGGFFRKLVLIRYYICLD